MGDGVADVAELLPSTRKTIVGGVNAGTKRLVSDVRQQLAAANQKGYKRASKLGGLRPASASWNFSGKLDKDLRKMMAKSWKQVANALRGQDTRRKKSLHGGVFRRTLSRFGVHLNDNDLKHLRHKFGTASHAASKKQLSIDYASFLKHYTAAAGTKAVTRRRPSTAGLRRSTSAFGMNSSRKKNNLAGGGVAPQEYNPSARQFETSLSAHVKKALQIANAPADRRALKAALASARSTGSITSRSRALSRGMPGSGRRSYRPGSASMQRSARRSASAASLRGGGGGGGGGGGVRVGSASGPMIVKTSQSNLGDTGPPPSTGRSSGRGQRYLDRRLSRHNAMGKSFDRSGVGSAGLMGSTTGSFGTLTLGRAQVHRGRDNNNNGRGHDSREEAESETGSLFRGRTPMRAASESRRGEDEKVDPGILRALCARLKSAIKDSWKAIRQDLKASDSLRSGALPARTFRSVMARHDVALSEDDFYMVMQSFSRNVGGNRSVHYDSFLRMVLR